jgi:hypothetical protein
MRERYNDSIAPVVAKRWAEEQGKESAISERTKEPKAGFRAQVAREFADLPPNEQKAFGERAKKDAAEAWAAYMSSLNSPPPTTPDARGKYVNKFICGRNPPAHTKIADALPTWLIL